ncbi:diguanylate cyclase [Photobacterium sagamiensis]|uniref:TackOD1 domain-containing metal-binding protein n=1 Tax=Photobacterium sagamiensis TaxID=2910241 RepID=UPI003D0B41F4
MGDNLESCEKVVVLGIPVPGFDNCIESLEQWDATVRPSLLVNVEPDHQDEVLLSIRSDLSRYLQPVFCVSKSKLSDVLADGMQDDIFRRLPTMLERLALLTVQTHSEPLDMLAWFSWPRTHFKLIPVWSAVYQKGYRYPLLDCLAGADAGSVLARSVEHQLLEIDSLLDRIRLCRHCHSERLNYVDVCPECSDIDIVLKPGVHCFVCGYVDDQEAFVPQGIMKCPKCSTTLRHIGVDYDRPLERFSCHACHTRFIEADVKVRCHDCGSLQTPDELAATPIHIYRTGNLARQIALEGSHLLHLPLTWGNPVSPDNFPWLLQWNSALLSRHGGEHTVMAILLGNLPEIKVELGLLQVQERIRELIKRLQNIFRDTDVVCQYADDLLLLLLPNTTTGVWTVLKQRILELTTIEGLDSLQLDVYVKSLPLQAEDDTGEWLKEWLSEAVLHV